MGSLDNFHIGGPECQCCNPPGKWERIREKFIEDLTRDLKESPRRNAMATRAKFTCQHTTKRWSNTWTPEGKPGPDGFVYDTTFFPVTGGSDENKKFFASTPSGQIQIGTTREDHFIPGKTYYVDFTEAE